MSLPAQSYLLFFALMIVVRWIKKPQWVDLVLLTVFGGFLVFSTYVGVEFNFDYPHAIGDYSALMNRFLDGHLDSGRMPNPRLLALPNPHPPSARVGIPVVWDYSLYQGKYFLYWGIGPILTTSLPYKLLTGRYLSEPTQSLIYVLMAFFFGYYLILRLIRRYKHREADPIERFFAAGTMSFSSLLATFAHRIAVCELALISSVGFVAAALYFTDRGRERVRSLYWAGACFGFAIACRPTAVFGLIAAYGMLESRKEWKKLACGMAPLIVLVAVYNTLRFGQPWEFGFKYQTNAVDHLNYFSWLNEFLGILGFLFQPVFGIDSFPHVVARPFGTNWLEVQHSYLNDPVFGLFFLSPFILLTVPRWIEWFRDRKYWSFAGLLLASACYLLVDAAAGITLRYIMESGFLLLLGSVAWILTRPRTNWLYVICSFGLLIYSINVSFFCSIAYDIFHTHLQHPGAEQVLRTLFK